MPARTMLVARCLLPITLLVAACGEPQATSRAFTEAEVRENFRAYLDALAQADAEKLGRLYHDDLAYVDPLGRAANKQQVLEALRNHEAKETRFTIVEEQIRIVDDVAVVQAVVKAEGGLDGQVRIEQVWVRLPATPQQAALLSFQSGSDTGVILSQINQLQGELGQLETQYRQDLSQGEGAEAQQVETQISNVEYQIRSLEARLNIGPGIPIATTQ